MALTRGLASFAAFFLRCFDFTATRAEVLFILLVGVLFVSNAVQAGPEKPNFLKPISNITVAVGREAILECSVQNLNSYKVAWLRVDTQTILTIDTFVITKNHRIGVTKVEQTTWYLHIKDVQESDKGWYMCQINTDPMESQLGYLDVVVPPDILDYPTSADMIVDENADVFLRCAATGSPLPTITWRREDSQPIKLINGSEVLEITGEFLNMTKVNRDQMGTYMCIASNRVPPSVSKRISLLVQFPPSVWIQYQLIGAYQGQRVTLECHSQAFPKSINYWAKNSGEIIPHSTKFVPEIIGENYKVHMKLTINYLGEQDFGIYKCIAKNPLGEMEGSVNVYKIPHPNLAAPSKDKSGLHDKLDQGNQQWPDTSQKVTMKIPLQEDMNTSQASKSRPTDCITFYNIISLFILYRLFFCSFT
ncbi:neurotrimin-like isoform X2 [Anthonomus grandis grandis]|uniref:neurotrimin-like isoform X2 n=1 Tax=Anthonomus grandis grandis TaxID=2921223 RepID=UPI002165C45C|nr:neurotrimin-like isoform X2 [Anthonomus grandis grandis]